jgi:hypothetical protein
MFFNLKNAFKFVSPSAVAATRHKHGPYHDDWPVAAAAAASCRARGQHTAPIAVVRRRGEHEGHQHAARVAPVQRAAMTLELDMPMLRSSPPAGRKLGRSMRGGKVSGGRREAAR